MKQLAVAALIPVIWVGAAIPAGAQDVELFDPFNLKLEASWVKMNTKVRLDSKTLELGAELSFEDDLGLGDQERVPSAAFEWQFGRKHRLALRWQDIDRSSSTQVLEEIRIGEEIIPIDANLGLGVNISAIDVDSQGDQFRGALDMDINDVSLYTRIHF